MNSQDKKAVESDIEAYIQGYVPEEEEQAFRSMLGRMSWEQRAHEIKRLTKRAQWKPMKNGKVGPLVAGIKIGDVTTPRSKYWGYHTQHDPKTGEMWWCKYDSGELVEKVLFRAISTM